jgi:radical SAM superfamily enzyme
MSALGCDSCSSSNYDEAFEEIKQRAKVAAVDNAEAQAEGKEYKYISAYYAYNNGFNVITVLSQWT